MGVFFILVEGLEDWPHPVPVVQWSGSDFHARLLSDGLQTEFREEAPSLKFSYVSPTTGADLLALFGKLEGARCAREFGEQVQAVVRAADRQKAHLDHFVKNQGSGAADQTQPAAKPGEGEGKGGSAHSDEKTPPQAADQFIFAPKGDGYYIAGFGESGHVTRLKGFDIIARLVRTPSVPVPMLELAGVADDERIAADRRSPQEALDSQAKKEISDTLAELHADREKAKAENNTVEMASAEQQIEELESRLREATGLAGRSRDINSKTDKLRPRIHRNLDTVAKTLRSARPPMNELANHFEAAISSESGAFMYRPATPIEWTTSAPAKK